MFRFFKSKKLFLFIDYNEMELVDLDSGKSVKMKSEQKFSKNGLIVAQFTIAEGLLFNLLGKLYKMRFQPLLQIVVQPKMFKDEVLSEVERRILLELCSRGGGRKVVIHESDIKLTLQVARNILRK